MAARPPQPPDLDRTLIDSPDDTAQPEVDATLVGDSPTDADAAASTANPDATISESPVAASSDAAATMIEANTLAPVTSDDDRTIVESNGPAPDPERTLTMGPMFDEPRGDETAATMLTPADEQAADDATMIQPSQSDELGQTVVGDMAMSGRDPDDTGYDEGAASSDPYDQTMVQGSGAGTASGTAADYIPPQESKSKRKSEYPNLGRFEILKLLGQGAFGAVYLAHDPHLDRKVAIKVAKTGVLVGKQDVDRFMREARSAAQLRHPNIVPVYEVGQLTNTNFIAYEFIEGRTLGDLMKEKKTLPQVEAAKYMKKIAAGLDYAHQHGIVHRDMKPDNVLLDVHNEPHIADFGLARRDEKDTTRTREGMFMGTPSYMSPEQASGKAHLADARSDVWSLGVMLQEMLTGVRPFRGNVTEVLVAVQNYEPPPVRTIDKTIPADLETIIAKCLTKSAEERYQSAQMLSDELDRWLRGEPILARPISVFGRTWRWMKRNPEVASLLGLVALVLCVGTIVSTLFGISATRSRDLAHQQALQRAEAQLTSVRTADAASLPVLVDSLTAYRDQLHDQLMGLIGNEELTEAEQSRARLAAATLYPDAAEHDELLSQTADDLLTVSPTELVVRGQMLKPFREQVEGPLWNAAGDSVLTQRQRFAALAALATLESPLPDWSTRTDDMVAEMLAMNPLEISEWLPAVAPIRSELEAPLIESFTKGTDTNAQYRAAIVLGKLFQDRPETLIALLPQARPDQLGPLLEALKPRADFYAERLSDQLLKTLATPDGTPPTDEQATAAANFALALLGLGREDSVWPLLDESPNEHLRTTLIHSITPARIAWQQIATRLEWEETPGVTAALVLTLGEYGDGELLPKDREQLTPVLLDLFRTHPNPGVHSAADWVLRRWGQGAQVDAALAELKSKERNPELGWHVTPHGGTFAVIAPATFTMGSPETEEGRRSEEVQHRRLIPRTYGIAMREVTVAEYMEFDPDFKIKIARRWAPEDTCPIINLKWYDAAAYCRWLSEKEGLAEHEMCYPPLDQLNELRKKVGARSLVLPDDLLDRPGYRLPTAAEWEYAARGGTVTSRPFGNLPTYVTEYAWYRDNGEDHVWPTGLLKPNDFGLFDVQGNALEWCHNYFFDTPPEAGPNGVVIDGPDSRDGFNREGRGGSNRYPIESLRVAYGDFIPPGNIDSDFGFRLARTYSAAKPNE